MTFLGPLWLAALALAALPVLVHLAFRLRSRRLSLPSLLLFHRLAPRLQARKRLRDRLVLLLRAVLLALVALALARPLLGGLGGGGNAALALVIDNSASMAASARRDGSTRLALACEGAAALLAAMGAGDRAAVLPAVQDGSRDDADRLLGDRARLRSVLDGLRPTEAACSPARALARAAALLAGSSLPRREIHLFTDCQEHEWGVEAGVELPPGVRVLVHRIPGDPPEPDAALVDLRLPGRSVVAGRPLPVRVSLANPGRREAVVTVRLEDDAGQVRSVQVTVPAQGRSELPLALPAPAPGEHWLQVRLSGDALPSDDSGFLAFTSVPPRTVLLLGRRAQFGALPLALAPAADGSLSGLLVQPVEAATLAAALAAKPGPALVCASFPDLTALPWQAVNALRTWVGAGGRLLAQPASAEDRSAPPDWCQVRLEGRLDQAAGVPLLALDPGHRAWRDLVGPDGAVALDARAFKASFLGGSGGLLGSAEGRALLVERPHGRGAVLVSGLAWQRPASDLPLSPAFLAFAQGLALPPSEAADPALLAGEALRLALPGDAQLQVRAVAGTGYAWRGPVSALPPPARAGIYLLEGPRLRQVIAVRAHPGEAAPARVEGGRLPALGGGPQQVMTFSDGAGLVAAWRSQASGFAGWPWLLLLALVVFATEGWLANKPLVAGKPA